MSISTSPTADASRASLDNERELVSWLQGTVARRDGVNFPDEVLQELFAAALKLYEQKFEAGTRIPPVSPDPELSATTTLITVSMLLKAADLELFELGMWQSFSGVR